MNMLADVGNGTLNIMILNNGRAMESKAWTEKMGIHQCFMRIQNEVMDKTGIKLPDEVINNYLRYGETDVDEKWLVRDQFINPAESKAEGYNLNIPAI